MERTFVDEARLEVAAGDGGSGCMSFAREKYKPKGKPDGGNGGNGGSVLFRVDTNIGTLAEIARTHTVKAPRGTHGSGNDRHGASGDDKVVLVPDGTVVRDADTGEVLADLVGAGTEVAVAKGGRGGRGNAALATPRRRAPAFSEKGEPGERRRLALELKVLADVGLVGFPNAGKSSLIARLSAARPKVAAYPFTTLSPHLGVAQDGDMRFVVADVPGLIEGASEGKGLGLAFLRHLERCRVLCFVLDSAAPEDAAAALEALRSELRAHLPAFDERPGVVAANKIDLEGSDAGVASARAAAAGAGFEFVPVSAERGDGVEDLRAALARAVRAAEASEPVVSHRLYRIRPEDPSVVIEREDDAWRVRCAPAERLLERFDVGNDDALRYIQHRLVDLGVEQALDRAGAREGDEVRIGGIAFEYEPEGAPR